MSASAEAILIAKRCVGCQIFPLPTDMEALFGPDWKNQTLCIRCRISGTEDHGLRVMPASTYNPGTNNIHHRAEHKDKVFVAFFPKLAGLPASEIKDCYVPIKGRVACKEKWREMRTQVWLSDGERFWRWTSWPHGVNYHQSWDEFLKVAPEWELLPIEGEDTSNWFKHILL